MFPVFVSLEFSSVSLNFTFSLWFWGFRALPSFACFKHVLTASKRGDVKMTSCGAWPSKASLYLLSRGLKITTKNQVNGYEINLKTWFHFEWGHSTEFCLQTQGFWTIFFIFHTKVCNWQVSVVLLNGIKAY